jgi:hypothetical protein
MANQKGHMDHNKNSAQEVLDGFKKTVDELAKKAIQQKQNDVDIQIENLRKEIKDLKNGDENPVVLAPVSEQNPPLK